MALQESDEVQRLIAQVSAATPIKNTMVPFPTIPRERDYTRLFVFCGLLVEVTGLVLYGEHFL